MLKAPSGLVHADGMPKPSFEALRGLIKGDWWLPPTDFITDDAGRIAFQGTAGTYTVTSESEQATVDVNLGPARSALEVTLNA